jgi:succinate dehydrogenase/fumarate reductase cytochrome b subunit
MLLTLLFEFSFGRYQGQSWNAMLAEYNLLKGKLWALVPLWILLAPLLFFYATK